MSQNEKTCQQFPLPKGWRWAKLEQICSVHPGQHVLEAYYNREKVGIGYLTGPDDFGEMFPSITKWTENAKAWCQPGDILVTVKGAGVGKSNLAPEDKVAIGRQLMAVRPKTDTVDQFFLYNYIVLQLSDLRKKAMGSTVPGLSRRDIENIYIPLPPFLEQRRIAAKIEELMQGVERARAACERQLEAAKTLPTSYLREVFESEEAKKWDRRKLIEVCEKPEYGYTASANSAAVGPKFLRITDIQDGKVNWDEVPYCRDNEQANRLLLNVGDILFARTGATTGKSYLIQDNPPKAIFASYLIRVRTRSALLPDYLNLFLQSRPYWNQVEINKRGGSQPNMNAKLLADIIIPVPAIQQQHSIIYLLLNKIKHSESLLKLIKNQHSSFYVLPQAILTNAFRGSL